MNYSMDPRNYYIGRDLGNVKGSICQNFYSTNDFGRETSTVLRSPNTMNQTVPEMNQKTLDCFCWPEQCHGSVVSFILNK